MLGVVDCSGVSDDYIQLFCHKMQEAVSKVEVGFASTLLGAMVFLMSLTYLTNNSDKDELCRLGLSLGEAEAGDRWRHSGRFRAGWLENHPIWIVYFILGGVPWGGALQYSHEYIDIVKDLVSLQDLTSWAVLGRPGCRDWPYRERAAGSQSKNWCAIAFFFSEIPFCRSFGSLKDIPTKRSQFESDARTFEDTLTKSSVRPLRSFARQPGCRIVGSWR